MQYYLRTGLCKFGASCKFHHPRNAGGSLSDAPLNMYGFPLRPVKIHLSFCINMLCVYWTMVSMYLFVLFCFFQLHLLNLMFELFDAFVYHYRRRKSVPIIWKQGIANLVLLVLSTILNQLLYPGKQLHTHFIWHCSLFLDLPQNNTVVHHLALGLQGIHSYLIHIRLALMVLWFFTQGWFQFQVGVNQ